jgi:hypothetical protein
MGVKHGGYVLCNKYSKSNVPREYPPCCRIYADISKAIPGSEF